MIFIRASLPHRLLLAAALLLLATPPAGWAAPGADRSIEIVDLDVGFADHLVDLRPQFWYPVWITLRAGAAPVQAELSLQDPKSSLVVTLPVSCAVGATRRYLAYYRFEEQPSGLLAARLDGPGLDGAATEFPVSLGPTAGRVEVLVIADETQAFRFLREFPPVAKEFQLIADLGTFNVIEGRIDHLPDNPLALEGLDAIILATSRLRDLTPEQWAALIDFTALGGNLLVASGALQPFLEYASLPGGLASAPGEPRPHPVTSGSLLLSPLSGPFDRIALEHDNLPLIVGRRHGRGTIWLSAASMTNEELSALNRLAPDQLKLWHGILSGSADETAPDQWFEFRTYLRETIGEILGGEVVSAGWLLKSFTSYAAFLLLLWMGLRWRRRTEWFWILALLPALAWGTLTLRRGLARHGGETSAASAEVFMLPGQDGLKARWTSISAVYSPGNARLNFPLEQHGLLSPAISWSDYHRVFFPLTFDQGSSPAMRGLRILPMSYHSFCLEGAFDSTGSLLLKADDDSTGALRLHNNSGFTFNYWVVLYRDFITSGTAMTAGTDSPSVWYPFRPYDELRSEDRSFADRDYLFGLVNAYCYRAEWKPENPLFIGISGDSRFPGAALPAIPGKGFLAVIQELNAPAHLPRDSAGDWALHWTPHDAYSYDYRSRLPVTIDGRATLDFVHCSPAAFDPARPLVVSLGGVDQAKRDQDNMLYDEAMTMDEGLMDIEASMFDASSGLSFDDPRPHHRPADTMQELEERIATQPVDADWEVYNFGCGAWERLGIGSQFRLCPARDFVTPVEPRMMLRLHIPESSAGGEPITAGEDELMEMESPELNISFELGAYRIHQPPAPDDSSHSAPAEVAQ